MAAAADLVEAAMKEAQERGYTCALSHQIMAEPVVASDGYTYEREQIERVLNSTKISPMTREILIDTPGTLRPNRGKKSEISVFLQKHPELYEGDEIYLPESWVKQFVAAIKANQIKEVQELLIRDTRLLRLKLEGGYTAFHLAAQFGSAELANILLENLTKRKVVDEVLKQPPAGFKPIYLNVVLQLQEQVNRIKQLEGVVKERDSQIQQQAKQLEQRAERIAQLERELKNKSEVPSSGPAITPQYQAQSKPSSKVEVKVSAEDIQTFLNHVVAGAQPEAEAMLKKNSDLALAVGTVTDHAKRTFKNITGFQYAVWTLDWQMWRMIKSYLSQEAAIEQARGFSQGPWVKEHGEHANWKKVTDALQTLVDNWDQWDDWNERNQHWVQQVGGAQLLLPIHVLQEYNQDRPFYPCPKFDAEYTRGIVGCHLEGLGRSFAFVRGQRSGVYGAGAQGGGPRLPRQEEARWDRNALGSLFRTRTQQRAELVAELLPKQSLSPWN